MMKIAAPSDIAPDVQLRQRISVTGAVQGVGFRPFVYRAATALKLAGWVANSSTGVTIEVEGQAGAIADLVRAIQRNPPVHARVAAVTIDNLAAQHQHQFALRPSQGQCGAEILPDLATCDDCLREIQDPSNRRFRYPFINCTQCGPRYSIVEAMPYDRERTSMRHFTLCDRCQDEYDNPADRRFHAEPTACPACGPHLELWDPSGKRLCRDHTALLAAANAIREGLIVAVKGVGGFHLAADARNETTVQTLRTRKHRKEKPFAVMFPTVADIRHYCRLTDTAAALLTASARPIVLLEKYRQALASSVAPDNPRLGAILPYAPLHHLLMQELGFPIVTTSGNLSGEPIVVDEQEALQRLAGITDLLLVHNRPILRPLDDSVAQIVCGQPQLLRRARGYAPKPITVKACTDGVLAFGGHLKATVAIGHGNDIVLSQHLGDLNTVAARDAHSNALSDLTELRGTKQRLAVCDLHPDYASSRAAEASGLPVLKVQHHVAHVAACLAEQGLTPPALGVSWDGTGFGPDGSIWGGEFLRVDDAGWQRLGHLRPFRLPGGDAAMREPRRSALGLLYAAFGNDCFAIPELAPITAFDPTELKVLKTMLAGTINAPLTSSMGRLFDAFAALCGLRQHSSYEGQAAMTLQWAADDRPSQRAYPFPLRERTNNPNLLLDWQPALEAILADLRTGQSVGAISAALHNGLAAAIVAMAEHVGESRVILTGGCFQNTRLTETTVEALAVAGFEPLWHRQVPPNDGGIALGQAAWASWRPEEQNPCA